MGKALHHRGPDDSGSYLSRERKVGLSFRRLAIIDLSEKGHQPMNYKNRYWIVFNGEIYNFQEKRTELEREGYLFTSHSDTEVILALYDKYGTDCLVHLRGMFAFTIYDEQTGVLFCARDRVGKKPFKYYQDGEVFIFASELKAILTQPEYKKEPDFVAIHHYLTYQYCPAPLTGFKNIKKLEPGHFLLLNTRTGQLQKECYWKLDYTKKLHLSEKKWIKLIREKLSESVRIRMISDVPLGAFLSGGVDSSAVVAYMTEHSKEPIKTFSIGFKEEKFNELPYAKKIAKQFNTRHTEFIVESKAIEILPMLVKQYEEPYADPSALPTFYLSKLTREHVTVALNGDGGDENFAGYNSYQIFKWTLLYEPLSFFHSLFVLPISRFLTTVFRTEFFHKAYKFSQSLAEKRDRRFLHYMCHFNNSMKDYLYTDDFKQKVSKEDSFALFEKMMQSAVTINPMDRVFSTDIRTYLPDALMTKVDIATMAASLEGRSPFLDHEFLELTAKIPDHLKLKGLRKKKYILKKALEGILPKDILYRPKKGFGVPLNEWFRDELREYSRGILLAPSAQCHTFLKAEAVKELLDDHVSGKRNNGSLIWNLLVLELWLQEYFDLVT